MLEDNDAARLHQLAGAQPSKRLLPLSGAAIGRIEKAEAGAHALLAQPAESHAKECICGVESCAVLPCNCDCHKPAEGKL